MSIERDSNDDSGLAAESRRTAHGEASPNRITGDEMAVRVGGPHHGRFTAADPDTADVMILGHSKRAKTESTVLSLREPREKNQVADVTSLLDAAHHLANAPGRLCF